MKTLAPKVAKFEQHLLARRNRDGTPRYTERTARGYALLLDRALASGNALSILRRARTTAQWMFASHATLAWARWLDDKVLEAEVLACRDPGQGTKEVQPPSDADWARILAVVETLPEPERSVLTIITTSGLRVGDILHITRANAALSATNRQITILQKGMHPREWAPATAAREAFGRLVAIPGWTLIRDLVLPLGNRAVTDIQRDTAAYDHARAVLKEVCHAAGVEFVRFHRFRHAVSEAMRKRGMSTEERQKLLGHRDYETTNRYYTHASAEKQIEMVDDMIADIRKNTP